MPLQYLVRKQQQQLQQCQIRNGFVIERISVFVNKGGIYVTQENVCNENEDRVIGNKRCREEEEEEDKL